jgi:hypothetical protein
VIALAGRAGRERIAHGKRYRRGRGDSQPGIQRDPKTSAPQEISSTC